MSDLSDRSDLSEAFARSFFFLLALVRVVLPPPLIDRGRLSRSTGGMNVTLFGYPKAGKTTLFNLLTGAHAEVTAYEDGRREPNVRTTPVPDPRLDALHRLTPEKKKVSAQIDIVDLVGMAYGEVKNSLFLGQLRNADGLVHVVRGFRDASIPHPKDRVDPAGDIRIMEEEMVLTDLVLVEARAERVEKDLGKMKSPDLEKEREVLRKVRAQLESGHPLRELELAPAEEKAIRSFALLSLKPLLHMVNLDDSDDEAAVLASIPPAPGRRVLAFRGRLEAEILELPDEEKAEFRKSFGVERTGAEKFWSGALEWLSLGVFFTIGKEDVHTWMTERDAPAVKAAGAIHTDFESRFIRAEIIAYDDYLRVGSWARARDAGVIRVEGRDHPIHDGDIVNFRVSQ